MSLPAETPQPRWQWLDWWFAPRWRALLTWVALTAITATALLANLFRLGDMTERPIDYLNRVLPAPLPPIFKWVATSLTIALLMIWFQPLALRLSLRRGLAWIAVPSVATILQYILDRFYSGEWIQHAIQGGSAALQCWILWGWRSRPWMCLLVWAATSALSMFEPLRHLAPYWLRTAVSEFPSAALLLYGTRLLRPEERVRGRQDDQQMQ